MLLRQGRFLVDGIFQKCDVRVRGSIIADIEGRLVPQMNEVVVSLDNVCVIPGLINSHDHLEFNLFSKLGQPPYHNYVDWSDDIQNRAQEQIREVMQVPLRLRLLWGAYKNIFSGVTTVVQHNHYYWQLRFGYPLEVYHPYQWIHSLKLEKRDLRKLLNVDKSLLFIHLAEGVDSVAGSEVRELRDLGGLTNRTVIIHGISLTDGDISALSSFGGGMIWCPSSNYYLFGETAPIEKMIGKIKMALGTDSTLSGSTSLLDEMRVARNSKGLTAQQVIDLVTSLPAAMLGLNRGGLRRGNRADFLMFDSHGREPFEEVLSLTTKDVLCLWKDGAPLYGDVGFAGIEWAKRKTFSRIEVDGRGKHVWGDFPKLVSKIKRFSPALVLPPILPNFS
jgi:cytosine/adenosine deaminase-related metal-dependent hydrolase